ncbi:ATP-NAD kinase-like domain-containing protein [Protomyces lactucae-debilis]|uniref:ATP-NAD kinase-like domain-containing protein n=1 Tax=Protomyces lactucae-debilis TaxID=2754530 RepID=A0A1Y2FP51_PROLT|nr:ATP-NAD kinase-like domain-containing protein [Protomyces lactucae-debilis]ORY84495.1 ATP-NAD kinase-like domain-containing protein [Protomyces lactucae-debilis]
MSAFDNLDIGTRRSSSVLTLSSYKSSYGRERSFDARSYDLGNAPISPTEPRRFADDRRRSNIALTASHVRRQSNGLNFGKADSKYKAAKDMDEPVLLSKEGSGYLFFSISSDGMLNYKTASRISGSMTSYLVDPLTFNGERAPVVVLTSPASGEGNALQTYQRLLLPILKHFKVDHSHIALSDANTASYLAKNGQYTANTIFILLSGDGVLHEVINGLAENTHFEAHYTPIRLCPIPCGSGNGLASSLKMTNVARGIRALFKPNWTTLPVLHAKSSAGSINRYAAVVVSYGLHAALVDDSASTEFREKYGTDRFKEAANRHLRPKPYLYKGKLSLTKACRFPDLNSEAARDQEVGSNHTYVLITRCSSLESDWRIAPMASPTAYPDKLDVVRMGDMSGTDLGRILMDAYKNGAQNARLY